MKNHITLILALLFAGMAQAQITFKIQGQRVSQVLEMYSKLMDKELVIEPNATNQWKTINLQTTTKSVTKKEAAKMIESALRDQADVAITPLDDKRVSVKLVKKQP